MKLMNIAKYSNSIKNIENWLSYAEVNDRLEGKASELFIDALDKHEELLKLRRSIENSLDLKRFSVKLAQK